MIDKDDLGPVVPANLCGELNVFTGGDDANKDIVEANGQWIQQK